MTTERSTETSTIYSVDLERDARGEDGLTPLDATSVAFKTGTGYLLAYVDGEDLVICPRIGAGGELLLGSYVDHSEVRVRAAGVVAGTSAVSRR